MKFLRPKHKISRKDFTSRWVQCAILAVMATILSVSMSAFGWRWSQFLDVTSLDFGFGLRGANPPAVVAEQLPQSRDIVIVELPAEIPRAVLAKLIDRLKLAKVVGLDLMFSDQEGELSEEERVLFSSNIERWKRDNKILATSIARSKNVVVGMWPDHVYSPLEGHVGLVESQIVWQLPEKSILKGATLAHLGVLPDAQDGLIRRVKLWEKAGQISSEMSRKNRGKEDVPSFALAIAAKAKGVSPKELSKNVPRLNDGSMYIDYLGPRQIFEYETNRIVFERAINWAEDEDFAGKIVLVGQTDYRAKDTFATPFGDIPGVFIHGNIIATLLSNTGAPALLGLPFIFALSLLAALMIIAPLLRYPVWMCLPFAVVEMIGFWLLSAYIFVNWHAIFPVSAPLWAIFFTYNAVAIYEYARARSTLGRVVGRKVTAQLLDAVATPTLGGEETVATAFFCDLRGYTTLSQTLPPEKLLALLNLYTNAVVQQVQVFGGRPIDYFGDGVFVLFEGSNHAMRALKAAFAAQTVIRDQFTELKQAAKNRPELEDAAAQRLKAGIAIHSGPMMVGLVGSTAHMKPGAVGDNVNIAARVQTLSDECGYSILLTLPTYEAAIKDNDVLGVNFMEKIEIVSCGTFTLKGREGKTEVFGAGEKFGILAPETHEEKTAKNLNGTQLKIPLDNVERHP